MKLIINWLILSWRPKRRRRGRRKRKRGRRRRPILLLFLNVYLCNLLISECLSVWDIVSKRGCELMQIIPCENRKKDVAKHWYFSLSPGIPLIVSNKRLRNFSGKAYNALQKFDISTRSICKRTFRFTQMESK